MAEVSARDALRYATEDEMVKLYVVVSGGWLLLFVAEFAFNRLTVGVMSFVGVVAFLAGVLATFAGLVGIAYKLLRETRTD
ncbi:hypothetical protein C453_08973 [Haloferax elongans ATCC BAA-1513]|uniref:Uncharacterized protein n=1 Tax=Haloferax elongans ATCC BAA-1513 TaxID=1230453 RepID=M0HN49_HALEO|nr:hypothetical protein [Haloferax elongans]ELZ85936.1 hypothetical protein C453_08973 [Haloferax elongans ATCC BAA-1513]